MKKRIEMKKCIGILVIMLLIPAVLSGCKPKIKADQSAKILADFVIKNDGSEMNKLGDSKSSVYSSTENQKKKFKENFKDGFEKSSGMTLDDGKVDKFYKAYINATKKINITTNKISESDKTAKVNVKVTYIDFKKIVFDAMGKTLTSTFDNVGNSEEELSNKYFDDVVNGLNNAKPSTKTEQKTFDFVIKDHVWVPKDAHTFFDEISDMSLGNVDEEFSKLKMTPDKSAKMLFDFYIKDDRTGEAKIFADLTGKSYGDKMESEKQEAFRKSLKSGFTGEGITVTDDDCDKIYSAYKNAIKNITVTSSKISESGNTAMVSIKTTYVDFSNISKTAASEAISDIKAKGLTDENEAKTEVVQAFVSHFEKDLNAAKPSTEMKEKTFQFLLKGFLWVPEDSNDFGTEIGNMIVGM